MNSIHSRTKKPTIPFHSAAAVLSSLALISLGRPAVLAQQPSPPQQPPQSQTATTTEAAPKIPNDQLDSLVAPIALYPDPLLSQTLVASTYPLEIIQLEQWMKKNKDLKGKALADAVEKQKWDPSIQAMAVFPDVVKQLAENVTWTSDLGNAFLAQQADVMDAVQRMRAKAQGNGNLKTSKEQKVETKNVENKQVIVIEQADPTVVYVPTYNPTVVYGAPLYPYPPIVYPPYYGALAFGAGLAIGAAWGNGGWGYGCGWGHGDVNVNVNNKYVNNYNKQNNIKGGNNNWQHNPQHRGGAPYGDRGTANKYAGTARQQPSGGAGNRPGAGGSGTMNRPGGGAGAGTRPGGGGAGTMDRPGGGSGGNRPGGGGGGQADRPSGGGASTRPGGGGGGEHIGGRSPSKGGGGGAAFGGGGDGGGNFARASSNRGGHSMGGGGFSRGGGGGGGHRGGGGRRR
jgi:hypothetical protein